MRIDAVAKRINPIVRGLMAWSHLKRSLANLAKRNCR